MRRLLLVTAIACAAIRAQAEQLPYTAHVNADDVYLRSGPGDNYYPVTKLPRGFAVEVYRHDPGGWCAIRPPEGTFSWVAAEFIEPRNGNIGVVTGANVVARVGSAFSDTRDVIQVRLKHGEELQILEAQELNFGSIVRSWYKVLPPAGEFRFIHARHLRRAANRAHSDERAVQDHASTADDESEDDEDVHLTAHDEPPAKARSKAARRRQPAARRPSAAADDTGDESPRDDAPSARLDPEHRQPQANLKEEAADLDLALSAMVTEEPPEWDSAVLRRQAENALSRAETALDRGRIRRVLRKIDNFTDIQERYLAVMDGRAKPPRPALAGVETRRASSTLFAPRYDGVGRLTQLASLDPRLPQFALVDSRGQVAAYVSPAPGVNLRRYLNQEVGINGTMGYLPERQAQHLTAKRIVPVDGPTLR